MRNDDEPAIQELTDPLHLLWVERLLAGIWGTENMPISVAMLLALSRSRNYVAGAFQHGRLVGAAVGFRARESGESLLHSHILGVAPEAQSLNVGYRLKLHQKAWARKEGIPAITWTFDPLVRRNAYFNLSKLGATVVSYKPDFYGRLGGLNGADETDRIVVRWDVESPDGREVDVGGALDRGASVILRDGGGEPQSSRSSSRALLAQVPADIVGMRETRPEVASRWRRELRSAISTSLTKGYSVSGFHRAGWYLLEKTKK